MREASGGRATPIFGDIFDHFDVLYEYADATPSILKTRYEDGCFGNYGHLIIGSKGCCTMGLERGDNHGPERVAVEEARARRADHVPHRAHDALSSHSGQQSAQ